MPTLVDYYPFNIFRTQASNECTCDVGAYPHFSVNVTYFYSELESEKNVFVL